MGDKLEPCPLCNGSAIYKTKSAIDDFLGTQTVSCRECCASAPLHNWNNRPSRERLQQENAELREFAEYCQGFLGCEETRDSMALHGITIKAKQLLNKNDN